MKSSKYYAGLFFLFGISTTVQTQTGTPRLEHFGLRDIRVKALALPSSSEAQPYLYAASDDSGILRRDISSSDSAWINLGLQGKKIMALDVQVWGIGPTVVQTPIVAVAPDLSQGDSTFIYKLENTQWLPADSGISKEFPLHFSALASFATSKHEMPGFAFVGSSEDFLFRSHTRSKHWDWLRGTYTIHTPTIHVIATQQKGERKEVWIGGDTGMHSFSPMIQKSANFCTTWQELSINLNLGLENTCYAFTFHPDDPDLVYAGMMGAVIKSSDGGKTWSFMGLRGKPSGWQFRALALDAFDSDHIFAGGMSFMGSSWTLWESFDAGKHWQEIPPPALSSDTDLGIIAIVADPILAGTIYVATTGAGVWKYSNSTVSVGEKRSRITPNVFSMEQNYPNPFNPGTEIRYQIPFPQKVELAVYDTKGRLIRMLVNSFQAAGIYSRKWDGRDGHGLRAASGIYFYHLRVGSSFAIRHKMALLQ